MSKALVDSYFRAEGALVVSSFVCFHSEPPPFVKLVGRKALTAGEESAASDSTEEEGRMVSYTRPGLAAVGSFWSPSLVQLQQLLFLLQEGKVVPYY